MHILYTHGRVATPFLSYSERDGQTGLSLSRCRYHAVYCRRGSVVGYRPVAAHRRSGRAAPFFRSHRVRCGGGRHGRRRNGNAGPGAGDGRGHRGGGRGRRPGRGARVHGHGVAGPAGTAQGAGDHGGRRRAAAGPGRGVPGRAVRRVPGTVHAARRVAHVVPESGGRVVRPEPLQAAAGRVPEAGVPAAAARPVGVRLQQAAVGRPAELPQTHHVVHGQPERGLPVPQHIRAAR